MFTSLPRRSWRLVGALAATSGLVTVGVTPEAGASPRAAASSLPTTLTIYSQGDVNVQSLWSKVLEPGFEKAFPGEKIKLVFSVPSSENTIVYDEIAASAAAKRQSSFDLVDGSVPAEAATANLLTKINASEIPLINEIDPNNFKPVLNEAVPLRGSQVLLAYNSKVISHPPTTLSALIAWIKANPGKFTYCNPSDGGSGSGFVQEVLSSFVPPAQNLKMALGYDAPAEGSWDQGFQLLKSLAPDIFNQQYPNSNTGVLTLLATGAIDMGPVWSDEGTAALKDGELPGYIKLTGVNPPFYGGPDYMGVPNNISQGEKSLAFKFINWALEPANQAAIAKAIEGTPGIELKYLPASVQKAFAGYNTPALPWSAKTGSDMNSEWTNRVAD